MSKGPQGTPLDLQAVDEAVERAEYTWGRDHEVVALLRTLRDQVRALRAAVGSTVGALIWTTGSEDFQEGGKAREGWLKLGRPALERAAAVLAQGKDEP